MGYYTQLAGTRDAGMSEENYYKFLTYTNRNYQRTEGVAALTQAGMSCIFTVAGYFTKDNNADSTSGTNSEDTERKRLQSELDAALNDIGANDQNGIAAAVTKAQEERNTAVNTAQETVTKLNNDINTYQTSLSAMIQQLNTMSQDDPQRAQLQTEISKLQESIKQAKKEYDSAVANLEQVTKNEDAKLTKINQRAQDALSILNQLEELNKADGSDTTTVPETKNAFNEFNTAKDKFLDAYNKKDYATAGQYIKTLTELYDSNQSSSSLRGAWKILEPKIKEVFAENQKSQITIKKPAV